MSLDSSAVRAVARVQRTVLSPLEYASTDAWATATGDALRDLFRADRSVVTVGGPEAEAVVLDGVGLRDLQVYADDVADRDRAGDLVLALPRPYYVEGDFEGAPAFEAHVASDAYNEWYRPLGLTRAVGMLVLGDPALSPDMYGEGVESVVANVLLAGSTMSAGPGAQRARMMLALLQPALAASVATIQRAALCVAESSSRVGGPTWLFDETGELLFESPDAGRLAAGARAGAGRVAADLLDAVRAGRPVALPLSLEVGRAQIVLQGSLIEPGSRRAVAVVVTASESGASTATRLRERFGLTPRQAEVARLLTQRLTNPEIAEALCISPHTARHHTEAVMRRLGVRDRRDVGGVIGSDGGTT